MENPLLCRLPALLLPWFRTCGRDLPWRKDTEPYHVWLSEIMLQQTRVEAVRDYYTRFLIALPSVEDLAACPEDRLLKLWEGLGYYTRVRNLQKSARIICEDYAGVFPSDYSAIRALPGIGDYTAGAIASICFGQPVPAVDGNVLRVLARLCDCADPVDSPAAKRQAAALLMPLYPGTDAGALTQSLMELGAIVCLPGGAPRCTACPAAEICLGRQRGTAAALPVKIGKKPRRVEEKTVFMLECDGAYAVEKRPDTGLLAGLWQFPNVPGHLTAQQALEQAVCWGAEPLGELRCIKRKHIFTHVEWHMYCWVMHVAALPSRFMRADEARLADDLALPTAFHIFLDACREEEKK